MRKIIIACLVCGSFLVGSTQVQADTVTNTDVTVSLTRPISTEKLPGQNPMATTEPDLSPNKYLPKTGDQLNLYYSVLGGILLGSSLYLYQYRKKKDVED